MLHTPSERLGSTVPLYGAGKNRGLGAYGPDHQSPSLIVGNALAGDTVVNCDYLDPGDGSGITAALTAAALLPYTYVDIRLRSGRYTIPNGTTFTLPQGVRLFGAGKRRTVLVVPPGSVTVQPWQTVFLAGVDSEVSDLSFAMTSINTAGASGNLTGVVTMQQVRTTVRNVDFFADGNPTFTITGFPWVTCINVEIPSVDTLLVQDVQGYFDEQDCTFAGAGNMSLNLVAAWAATTLGYDGSTGMPTFRQLSFRAHYTSTGSLFPEALNMRRFVAFDLDTLVATHTFSGVYCQQRDGTRTFGPNIRNVLHHMNDQTGCTAVMFQLRSAVAANPVENIHISNVRVTWEGAVGGTVYPVSIWTHASTTATLRNVTVSDVQAQRSTANGTIRCEVVPLGAGIVRNIAMSQIRLPQANSTIVLGGTAGALQDTAVTSSHVDDFFIDTSCVDTIVANNRFYGVYTNNGVGTSASNNI